MSLLDTQDNSAAASDNDLMLQYVDGSMQAFEELYSRYRKNLYQYVLNSCNGEPIASELFQEVWARVISSRHGYTPSAPFGAWLFRIARNLITDHYRSSHNRAKFVEYDDSSDSQIVELQTPLSPEEMAQIDQRTNALQTALKILPDEQREALLLQHIAGLSISEIAEVSSSSNETIKSRLRYGIAKLRKHLRSPS